MIGRSILRRCQHVNIFKRYGLQNFTLRPMIDKAF